MSKNITGIMGAMYEEVEGIISMLTDVSKTRLGNRTYYTGKINNREVVVVFSRWGKVAAATTVSTLVNVFGITQLIFTGVAGAIHHDLKIGDIVIGKRLIQHDMDARPLIQQYEIPLLSKVFLESNETLCVFAASVINHFLNKENLETAISKEELDSFNILNPRLHIGDIASGDQFFSGSKQKQDLCSSLPTVLCVEMEGAAVAQVCFEYEIPFCVIRTISDVADEQSHVDFVAFTQNIASKYSAQVVKNMLSLAAA